MAQTALDWFLSRVSKTSYDKMSELVEQAKKLEKQQRIQDYNAGYTDAQCNHINDAENYLNEITYMTDENTTH